MQYKVSYNAVQKTVYVQEFETDLKAGYSVLGLFTAEEIENGDVFYHKAQSLLNQHGITDMANIRIFTDVNNARVAKPYKTGTLVAIYDQQGGLAGLQDRTGKLIPFGIGNAQIDNGLAIVDIDGQNFALLPVDEDGSVYANVTHRRGNLADLITVDGNVGEIGVSTDTKALIVYNGEPGGATIFKKLDNIEAVGPNSMAIGQDALTLPQAHDSLAVGRFAVAEIGGQTVFGSGIDGVSSSIVHLNLRTTNVDFLQMTTDGLEATPTSVPKLVRDGVFDITAVVLARQVGTNNWARFERRAVVRKNGSSTALAGATTPTPDVASVLTGITATLGATGGGLIYVAVEGLDGVAIQWGAYLTINALNLNV